MMDRFDVQVLYLLCLLLQMEIASSLQCPEWSGSENIWTQGIHDGTCYIVLRDGTKSWHDAKSVCERNGWRLFHIKTPEKHKFYSSALLAARTPYMSACFWMGLSDSEKEGEWKWTDGSIATYELVETDLSFLTKWTYDCVAYCEGKTEYRWRAKECEELGRWHYICDQDALETTTVPSTTTSENKETSTPTRRELRKETFVAVQRIPGKGDSRLLSEPEAVVRAFSPSVCARICVSSQTFVCVLFNHNKSKGSCALYSSLNVLECGREHQEGWEIWRLR